MPIKTLIFDLGRTLVPFSFDPLEPRLQACRPEAMRLLSQVETGAATPGQFEESLCRLIGLSPAEFEGWWNSIFELRWLIPPEWIRVASRHYRIGLLSNTNHAHFAFLREQMPMLDELHFHILSYEVKAAKPEAAIYAAAESQTQCRPEEIFYVDDIAEFVTAARQRGWQAALFTSAEALVRDAQRCGIRFGPEELLAGR